jgi:hypothetical protein
MGSASRRRAELRTSSRQRDDSLPDAGADPPISTMIFFDFLRHV